MPSALALAALVPLAAAVPSPVLAAHAGPAWRSPVPGVVARPFDLGADRFEAGRHRGVDLAATPGTPVRAPCGGPVVFAGAVGGQRIVTLRCGPWRVTHLPLAAVAVGAGATVARGALLGTVAAARDHAGLHLGVRRAGTRFGYVDPAAFLAAGSGAQPPLGPAPRPARPPAGPRRAPPGSNPPPAGSLAGSKPAPVGSPAAAITAPGRAPPGADRGVRAPFAPWPAWLGLALVLAGAGLRLRGRPTTGRGRAAPAGTLTR